MPARRELEDNAAQRLVITSVDIQQATPFVAPARPFANPILGPGHVPTPPQRLRRSRLAIASLITAIVGIPLVGAVTGLVAVLLACLALGRIQARMCKGIGLALAGLVLGLADVVGWVIFIGYALSNHSTVILPAEAEVDLQAENVTPKILRAMQANVLIERSAGWAGKAIGSGVILEIKDGMALLVTNRHIVDPGFPGNSSPPDLADLNKGGLTVRLLKGPRRSGRVTWVAPNGIDLALVRIAINAGEAEFANWAPARSMKVGEAVFAIGNPQNLNWTHTQGVISQFRNMTFEGRTIRVIQTQTAINPGNSGGGLYDDNAFLIGINTWTSDKSSSEGLSFAITFNSLLDLEPPGLTIPKTEQRPAAREEKTP